MTLRSINPATLEVISEIEEMSAEEVEAKIVAADAAARSWRETTFAERSRLVKQVAVQLRAQSEFLAKIITAEVGKTLSASMAEVEKCATVCDYYADNAEKFLQTEVIITETAKNYIRSEPLGIILGVMPWNFPFWQVIRYVAPALMAGNVSVFKHASNVQGCAAAIERVFTEAGFPAGVLANLAIGSSRIADIIRDPRIRAITLTGSEKAGSEVAAVAGREIKKTVLELGGSDPFIVLADADLAKAVATAVAARMQFNAGQSCLAAKRFIVHESIVDEFSKLLAESVSKLVVGDPLDANTHVGPLSSAQAVSDIERQVADSVSTKGARVLVGGSRPDMKGCFYLPTVITAVKKGMPVYDEEVFGPVLPIITFRDTDEAIAIANDTAYGLGATIFSRDTELALRLSEKIESGTVYINSHIKSDARLPVGGIKKSGYGRELSHHGIREFVNIKTVSVPQ